MVCHGFLVCAERQQWGLSLLQLRLLTIVCLDVCMLSEVFPPVPPHQAAVAPCCPLHSGLNRYGALPDLLLIEKGLVERGTAYFLCFMQTYPDVL